MLAVSLKKTSKSSQQASLNKLRGDVLKSDTVFMYFNIIESLPFALPSSVFACVTSPRTSTMPSATSSSPRVALSSIRLPAANRPYLVEGAGRGRGTESERG